jgi:hypothetical protein
MGLKATNSLLPLIAVWMSAVSQLGKLPLSKSVADVIPNHAKLAR